MEGIIKNIDREDIDIKKILSIRKEKNKKWFILKKVNFKMREP
jgi:hypothetical protein